MFRKYVSCLAAALVYFYDFLQMNMLNTLGMPIVEKFSLSMRQYGILASLYFYFMLPTFLLAGIILDRYNTKKTVMSVSFLYTASAFFLYQSGEFETMCLSRAISGFCGGFCLISLIVLASQEFGKEKISKVIGAIVPMGMLGGAMAQAPLQLILLHYGIDDTLMINALLGLVIFGIICVVVNDRYVMPKNIRTIRQESIRNLLKNRQLIILGVYSGLLFLPVSILGGFCGTEYLITKYSIEKTMATFISSMIFIGVIFGSIFVGWVSGNVVAEKTCMIIGIVTTFLLSTIIFFLSCVNVKLFLFLFFFIGFFSASQILSFPLIAKMVDKNVLGTSEGIMSIIIMLLSALFQTFFGYILDIYRSYDLIILIFLMLLLLGIAISLHIEQPRKELGVH
jgi:MFS family permease